MELQYLITGTGRSGTAYAAQVLKSVGIKCGHEDIFSVGGFENAELMAEAQPDMVADSSWLAMPYLDQVPNTRVIHLVRHPQRVIPSLLKLRLFDDVPPRIVKPYANFIYLHAPSLREYNSALERATAFYLHWNDAITRKRPDARNVRVEDCPAALLKAVDVTEAENVFANKRYNSINPGRPVDLDEIPQGLRADLLTMMEHYGYGPLEIQPHPAIGPQVYWAVLMERSVMWEAVDSLFDIAGRAGRAGFTRISMPYARTDDARNQIIKSFLSVEGDPDDVLVMLDNDHTYPADTLEQLAKRPEDVVAALAFRRSKPHEPLWYVRHDDGTLRQPAQWESGQVYKCDAVGAGAIAIKRRVFMKFRDYGYEWPYFRYEYPEGFEGLMPTEDIYFSKLCESVGIKMHVHTGVVIPHLTIKAVGERQWRERVNDNTR